MIYCDTSLLVAALTSEAHSRSARAWLAKHVDNEIVISDWVIAEFGSAIAMKQRRGAIDPAQRILIETQWHNLTRFSLKIVSVERRHFLSAATFADHGRKGLRAGDALHLAIVADYGYMLVTFDADLADAALASGVAMAPIERIS